LAHYALKLILIIDNYDGLLDFGIKIIIFFIEQEILRKQSRTFDEFDTVRYYGLIITSWTQL